MENPALGPLIAQLHAEADEAYRIFNEGLMHGARGLTIGVRMPVLRKYARGILRAYPVEFLDTSLGSHIHEINLLHAIVLAAVNLPFAEKLKNLGKFVPTISNWAVCDTLCNDLHPSDDALPAFRSFLEPYLRSDREFEVRFALVMLMLRYHSDAWIDDTLQAYAGFRHPDYYAQMGAAWGLSMLYVHQREKTLAFLQSNNWDRFTHNKAIQKIIESRQVSAEDKQLLRKLKRQDSL